SLVENLTSARKGYLENQIRPTHAFSQALRASLLLLRAKTKGVGEGMRDEHSSSSAQVRPPKQLSSREAAAEEEMPLMPSAVGGCQRPATVRLREPSSRRQYPTAEAEGFAAGIDAWKWGIPTKTISSITLAAWENVNVFAACHRHDCCGRPTRRTQEADPTRVTGVAKPGTLTLAILGASGAGKEHSAQRCSRPETSPGLTIQGFSQRKDDMFIIGRMKVREHLWLSRRLLYANESKMSLRDRRQRVEEVLDEMGLVNGISGGEMKRLSFASEFANQSATDAFCDEPTSGLGTGYMAETVVRTLRRLAANGRTILRPRSRFATALFRPADADGEAAGRAYLGPASDALGFFADCGYPTCRRQLQPNPGDHFVHALGWRAAARKRVAGSEVDRSLAVWPFTQNIGPGRGRAGGRPLSGLSATASQVASVASQLTGQSPYERPGAGRCWRCCGAAGWPRLAGRERLRRAHPCRPSWWRVIVAAVYFDQRYDQNGVMNLNRRARRASSCCFRSASLWSSTGPSGWSASLSAFLMALLVVVLICKSAVSLAYFPPPARRIDIALAVSNPAILPFLRSWAILPQPGQPYLSGWTGSATCPGSATAYETLVVNQWSRVANISCPLDGSSG
uniref:ABC transporter domain-containing protein n=1 Tax=Macrostomum lignano TaxID=282301 RepID=A0A1I8FCN3_9PLAT